MTRRDLMLAAPVAMAAQASAQAPPQAQARPQTPEEEVNAVRAQQKRSGDQLAKFNVPMATEPAFQFQA